MALIRFCSLQALDSTRDLTDIQKQMNEVLLTVEPSKEIKIDAV